MDHNMTDYLDSIHASDRLKRKTKAYLRQKTHDYGRDTDRLRSSRLRKAACIAAAIVTLAGAGLYRLPVAYIDLDINPSVEINVNVLGRVISLNGLNPDGAQLVRDIDVSGMPYAEAIQRILISDELEPYISAGSTISISVSGSSVEQSEEMLMDVACRAYAVADKETIYCCSADLQTAREARNCGLSTARYQALTKLKQTNPNASPADVQSMTPAEICTLLCATQPENPCE